MRLEDLAELETENQIVRVKKVKHTPTVCADCGLTVEGRRTEHQLMSSKEYRVWRDHCVSCDRYRNPATGVFDLTKQQFWKEFRPSLRKKNK